ncbi:hypothetical protein ZWY2020_054592 [Hordeum vulgare]|nr:hypothetical protein ZWY2020_054592 [Hordeum vulgare]
MSFLPRCASSDLWQPALRRRAGWLSGSRFAVAPPQRLRERRPPARPTSPARSGRLAPARTLDLSCNRLLRPSGRLPASARCTTSKTLDLSALQPLLRRRPLRTSASARTSPPSTSAATRSTASPESMARLACSCASSSASSNRLLATCPRACGHGLAALQRLDLSDNALTGALPDSLATGDLSYLGLPRTGSPALSRWQCPAAIQARRAAPEGLANETLQWLDLSGNQLTGGILAEMALFFNLRYLNLPATTFRTQLPPELGLLRNLTVLDPPQQRPVWARARRPLRFRQFAVLQLDGNSLAGPIPRQHRKMPLLPTVAS